MVLEDGFAQLSIGKSIEVPVRKHHYATDITRRFTDASTSLDVGQLVKHDSLSLFDTVQALEIMDPKMDAGFLAEGETLDESFDASRSLLPEEIVWIMDQLLCYQMAWHQGYALPQNIFGSLHIDALLSNKRDIGDPPSFENPSTGGHPDELTQNVLGTFCVSMIKSTDICIEIVGNQQYYEEEDFNTQTFGRDLLTDFDDYKYFKLVNAAVNWLGKQHKKGRISERLALALRARLLLNCRLLESIYPIPADFPGLMQEGGRVAWSLEIIAGTHELGLPVENAFSVKLQRKLASTTPPRPLNVISFDDALSALRKLDDDLSEAFAIGSIDPEADMQQIEAFLWAFADREPLALPRAALQIHLFSEGKRAAPGAGSIEFMMWSEVDNRMLYKIDVSSVIPPKDPRFKAIAALEFWYEKGQQIFTDVLRCLCQNPCRIRRCLINTVQEIDDLVLLLGKEFGDDIERAQIEGVMAPGPYVQSLIYEITRLLELRVMKWIVALGFSQQLYDEDEIASVCMYQRAVVWQHLRCLRVLPDPIRESPECAVDEPAAKAVLIRLKWAESIQCLNAACAQLNVALVYLRALPELDTTHTGIYKPLLHFQPFVYLKSTPIIMGTKVGNLMSAGTREVAQAALTDLPLTPWLRDADSAVVKFKNSGLLELSKNFAHFRRHWLSARYSTTEAADLYWFMQLKMWCKTAFAVKVYSNILLKELDRCGSQEAMIGRVEVEMREVHTDQFALPTKMRILPGAVGRGRD